MPAAFTWAAIVATALLAAEWMSVAGLRFEWTSAIPLCAICLAVEGLALFYRTWRVEPRIAATLSGLSQLLVFSAAAAVLSYAVARTGGDFWDARLHAIDRRLGLDWRAYLAFVDAHPMLGHVFSLAYASLIPQTCLLVIILGLSGRLRALRAYITAFILVALASVGISAMMPAMAMYVHLGLTPADFANLDPAAAFVHVADLSGLRAGTLNVISLDHPEGIITFPSMHAALGMLFAHAFWTVRSLRIPAVSLNVLLIAATPIDGGHYFIDVLAGLVIAVAAITIAATLHRHPAAAQVGRTRAPVPLADRLPAPLR